jgi:hypothetical protein
MASKFPPNANKARPFTESLEPLNGAKLIQEGIVVFHFRSLAGRILTLVDASISDPQQNKAFKQLVKKEFRSQLYDIQGLTDSNSETSCVGGLMGDILD